MATTTAAILSSFSSLKLQNSTPRFSLPCSISPKSSPPPRQFLSISSKSLLRTGATPSDINSSFFDDLGPESDIVFEPPAVPEGYIPPPAFDEGPEETEEEITAAYEELYGRVIGVEKKGRSKFGKVRRDRIKDAMEERVIQVRRVTKVVKGGKQLHFRAVVVVGDKQGNVGVGVGKATEISSAVQKSAVNARRNLIAVPLTKYSTFPHPSQGKSGAATVMLRPASPGTGVIAGGAVRIILELAGLDNALGKQIGGKNALNNARATIVAISKMRQFRDVARQRGIPMEELWK